MYMEKLQQWEAVLMLIGGICLMLEGVYSPSGSPAAVEPGPAIVIVGPAGAQKSAQTKFLRRRYQLQVITADRVSSLSDDAGFLLEGYPEAKDPAEHLARLLRRRHQAAPFVIEIADRRAKTPPVDLYPIQRAYPAADIWTFDAAQPPESVSHTLEVLLGK